MVGPREFLSGILVLGIVTTRLLFVGLMIAGLGVFVIVVAISTPNSTVLKMFNIT